MKLYLRYLFVSLLLGINLQIAEAAELTDHPGYLDLKKLPFIDGKEPNVEVTLNGPVLKMLLQLPIQYDEEGHVKEMLKVVEQILVRSYKVTPEQADEMLTRIGETSETLEKQNWTRIVRVREEDDENVDIHVKLSDDGENLNGLVIMSVEKSRRNEDAEVVFVNIAGNFDPSYLANIGSQFDIDELDGVEVP